MDYIRDKVLEQYTLVSLSIWSHCINNRIKTSRLAYKLEYLSLPGNDSAPSRQAWQTRAMLWKCLIFFFFCLAFLRREYYIIIIISIIRINRSSLRNLILKKRIFRISLRNKYIYTSGTRAVRPETSSGFSCTKQSSRTG